jgi:hypothetical protein
MVIVWVTVPPLRRTAVRHPPTSYLAAACRGRKCPRFSNFSLPGRVPFHTIDPLAMLSPTAVKEPSMALTCPTCGNDRNFLVKTLQVHVVHLEDSRVEVAEESRPAVFEVLCDECETALNFADVEETLRKEVLLTLGAR